VLWPSADRTVHELSCYVNNWPTEACAVPKWRAMPTLNAYVAERMEREQAARRTRAALALAGYKNVEALAGALDGSGVGLKRLREIYQQRGGEPRRVELREIAEACGLPFEFFTADLTELGSDNSRTDELDELRGAVAVIGETVFEMVAAGRSGVGPATAESLRAQLERIRPARRHRGGA
jgi:hypothetical protein